MNACKSLALALTTLFTTAAYQEAQASGPYGAVTIKNRSTVTLKYEIRWGDGDWRPFSVNPGQMWHHSNELDGNGQHPRLQMRFDWIGGDGRVTYRTYDLPTFATWSQQGGKPYHFRFSRDGYFLDLYTE